MNTNTTTPGAPSRDDLPTLEDCRGLVPDGARSPDKLAALLHTVASVEGWSRYELKLGQSLKELRAAIDRANTLPHRGDAWWRVIHEIRAARRRIGQYAAKYKLTGHVPEWASNSLAAVAVRKAKGEP